MRGGYLYVQEAARGVVAVVPREVVEQENHETTLGASFVFFMPSWQVMMCLDLIDDPWLRPF